MTDYYEQILTSSICSCQATDKSACKVGLLSHCYPPVPLLLFGAAGQLLEIGPDPVLPVAKPP